MEKMPESRHRFNVGSNQEIRTRIDLVQETIREMQKERPEIVSFAMFGSMVKGYATSESDIDGKLIVNCDAKKMLKPSPRAEIYWHPASEISVSGAQQKMDLLPPCDIGARFDAETKTAYEKLVKEKITGKISTLTPDQLEHVEALPISFDIIDTVLKIWKDSMQEFADIKTAGDKIKKKNRNISEENLAFQMRSKGFRFPDENIAVSEYLSQLFFLDVGSGSLQPFRSHIIKKLFSYGAVGHAMWTRIIGFTEIMERKVDDATEEQLQTSVFTNIRYPRTLVEAKKVYG
jgi:hypothetical protein